MKSIPQIKIITVYVFLLLLSLGCAAQNTAQDETDKKVQKFLSDHRQEWNDLNVPYEDGQILHDLIVKNKSKSALEIGTSTGHSTIWLAWALKKTGGKLITLEIDEQRQKQAIQNIKEVGLSDVVEFKLGDAHKFVKELPGPFDFVFSDADKDWYLQYFKDVSPKLQKGGLFTAHNVSQNSRGISEFMDYIQKDAAYETRVDNTSRAGLSISRKK